jgi:flagellar hook-length control protein FliK
MNLPGIQNALAALTALNSSSGSKAPAVGPNTMRAEQPTFKQALSQEVAQRQNAFQPPARPQAGAKPQLNARPQQAAAQHAPQQAARPQAGDKAKEADKADKPEAQATDDTAAPADAAAPAAQAGTAKPEEKPAEDSAASLADIPGAPQAALMMQLMNTTPAAAATAAPAADAAPALDAALAGTGAAAGKDGKDVAANGPLDLRAVAGKNVSATAGQAAARDAAASADLQGAFGKAMADAGQQAVQALTAAQADTPAANAAPAALAALQAAVQAVHAPAGHVDKLTPAVGTPAWDQALGQKIVWMAQGGEQTATLTMNPPDLGPMQVVLSVSNNQATVDFMSAQPEVRQALESALPRLREMMGESGVQLGQANVSAGSQQQFAGFGGQNRSGGRAAGNDGLAIDDSAPQLRQGIVRMARDGVVDTFA